MSALDPSNPFAQPSTLPYQLPDFAAIELAHYVPAFEAGMAEQLAEVDAIATSALPATFANTVEAFELSGALLTRVANVFFNISSSDATPDIEAIEAQIAPRLAEHADALALNRSLYERFTAVPTDGLGPEELRLISEHLKNFELSGVALTADAQVKLRSINQELSALSTEFSQQVTRGINASALHVGDPAELAGLGPDDLATAAQAAVAADHEDGYLLTLILPTAQPALEVLQNRETRRKLFEASLGRGSRADQLNVLGVAAKMSALRAERAALLGFASEAERSIARQTAPSLEAVVSMLEPIAHAAAHNANAEALLLEAAAGHPIEAWDWAFYSEQVRREKYGVDLAALRPYFELDAVLRDGVFFAASKLYGLSFTERTDLVGYHPGVRVWEVFNADGTGLGLFLGDFFTRDTKRGGAWMNSFVEQARLTGAQPVVVNNLNIPQPPQGEPALLTYDELVTCFHEFGHALHGLFSDVEYPSLSGTNVPRDFVEYPSQVNEMWILWPEVLAIYAKHHLTGKPLPEGTAQKLQDASLWGQGFATAEYLGAALLDLAWHQLPAGQTVSDPLEFESQALSSVGLNLPAVPPRYRTGYFNHIFAGGYAAGYYSYIWSEILDADTVAWFKAHGGLTRQNGDRFRKLLLSRGNSQEPIEAFEEFASRPADTHHLLTRRGLN